MRELCCALRHPRFAHGFLKGWPVLVSLVHPSAAMDRIRRGRIIKCAPKLPITCGCVCKTVRYSVSAPGIPRLRGRIIILPAVSDRPFPRKTAKRLTTRAPNG
jgi:hypothetical protein